MPLRYIPHRPVTAPTFAVYSLVYIMVPITSEALSKPVLRSATISFGFPTLPALPATCKPITLPCYKQTKITIVEKIPMDQIPVTVSPSMVTSAYKNATSRISVTCTYPRKSFTYSLPVQKLDASLANHAMTPRSSSGRPMRPKGFKFDHFSRRWGCASRYAAVMLSHGIMVVSMRIQKKKCCADARRIYVSRRQRINANPFWAKFTGHASCHLEDG